ncbi:hypothetical protein, partial [Salmonella enterica]|uniref:hypothetical protein n=1 Tax=Salmonella enterica TaxID=28901 RepID=UPI000B128A12
MPFFSAGAVFGNQLYRIAAGSAGAVEKHNRDALRRRLHCSLLPMDPRLWRFFQLETFGRSISVVH